ncbi:hypothetical protein M8845_18880 [Gelidibacter japonicus]|uniref:hypothetical protein n=1 Tax=Gelidibacter japonicus TaxID=1962232 RepID=UPI002021F421|nr:hypothetical protein [Gelidibacter japonicus]MCL8009493.1 hypothetical protein [Gelidibacter japonicus]
MRKIVLKILFLAFIAVGCQQKKQTEINVSENNEQMKSNFDLKSDYQDFKTKMTELDTLKVWIDHSVCTYQGEERLLITKKSDSIKILSEFKDYDEQNPEWQKIFEKSITENDTTWDFGNFMERNKSRINSDDNEYVKIEIKNGEQKMKFVTKGLVDLNTFMAEYGTMMRKLYEPKKRQIYGVPLITETELINEE